jgi:hypothetical protein
LEMHGYLLEGEVVDDTSAHHRRSGRIDFGRSGTIYTQGRNTAPQEWIDLCLRNDRHVDQRRGDGSLDRRENLRDGRYAELLPGDYGLLAVRRRAPAFRWIDVVAMIFVLMIGFLSLAFALTGDMDGTTPVGFLFGAVALLAALGDIRMLMSQRMEWSQRIARHLWRMCFALWIATASFFLGQSDEFPEALRIMPLLCTPVLLVMLLMAYWLVRVLFTPWRPQA